MATDTSGYALSLWVLGAAVLAALLAYGIMGAGRLSRSEKHQLDRATERVQRSEDPQKM